jgi:hypothetical protein
MPSGKRANSWEAVMFNTPGIRTTSRYARITNSLT